MNATEATEQRATPRQDSPSQKSPTMDRLDRRYGEIGISAVAAAVCPKGEQRRTASSKFVDYDFD